MKEQVADQIPVSVEMLKQTPQLVPLLKNTYFSRMTVPGRFTPASIQAVLVDANLFDYNFSIKENLERAIERLPLDKVQRLLHNLIEIEAHNSRILALGEPL